MIPANEWWAVLQNYNLTVYPAQVVFYLLAIVALATFFTQPPAIANRVMKGFFVISFGWIGIVFFLLLGQQLPAHYVQAILFLSLAALFAADFLNQTSQFNVPRAGWRRAMTIAGLGLVMAYPLFSVLLGRPASQWIIPGTFPCPTTALALVLMATTFPAVRRWQYLVTLGLLMLWAIPFPVMIQIPKFGVYEDSIMLAMGLYALAALYWNWQSARPSRAVARTA